MYIGTEIERWGTVPRIVSYSLTLNKQQTYLRTKKVRQSGNFRSNLSFNHLTGTG